MTESCRSVEIGRCHALVEIRLRWEGRPPRPAWLRRAASLVVAVELRGPQAFLDEAWPDIASSVRVAGNLAGLPAILAAPEASFLIFQEAFRACLASRWPREAHRVRLGFSLRLCREGRWEAAPPPGEI